MKQKKLFPVEQVRFLQDCLLIEEEILVLSDLHIGFEEQNCLEGIIPRIQFQEMIKKFEEIFSQLKKEKILIKQVIICGDLKHEFGKISRTEWSETLRLIDYLDKKIDPLVKKDRIILVKGNHDLVLGPLIKKRAIQLKESYKTRGYLFLHGDKPLDKKEEGFKVIILGHLHPSITLRDNYKKEKYKCFLKGMWKNKLVYILPSFSEITFGYDVINEEGNKDFLIIKDFEMKKFEIIIYNKKNQMSYNFGRISELKRLTKK